MAKKKSPEGYVLDFICEAGLLKRTIRSGWSVLGIAPCESVAEHSFRCALIGYCLAKMEKADTYKVLLMTLFGDMQEARISDLHKMAQGYLPAVAAENKAYADQIGPLPENIKDDLYSARQGYVLQQSKESLVARDADILECLIQAREYLEQGHAQAVKFTRQAPACLKTASARKLWALAKSSKLNDWWQDLSKFKR